MEAASIADAVKGVEPPPALLPLVAVLLVELFPVDAPLVVDDAHAAAIVAAATTIATLAVQCPTWRCVSRMTPRQERVRAPLKTRPRS
jgi:hypothetical protein